MPSITVDSDTFAVRIDGELVTEARVSVLPMAHAPREDRIW